VRWSVDFTDATLSGHLAAKTWREADGGVRPFFGSDISSFSWHVVAAASRHIKALARPQ
jgi:hypothetical protein